MTAQAPEIIILDGTTNQLTCCPLVPAENDWIAVAETDHQQWVDENGDRHFQTIERWIDANGDLRSEISAELILYSTGCWRNYIGTWILEDGRLYLAGLIGCFRLLSEKPIFADWFTGTLCIPQGELLEYRHSGFNSVYEEDLFIEIERGLEVGRTVVDNRVVSLTDMHFQLRALGVRRGGVLLVHTSFRAVRPVEGGPEGLIAALLEAVGPDGTLVMPSWTGDDDAVFDLATTPANADLGIVADLFWRMEGAQRSDHPMAFAAIGPQAEEIVSGPLPLPPHIEASPVGRVHALDGQVLLLGVGHDANTTLHLAECIAGVPYGIANHTTILRDGAPIRIDYLENDHCSAKFALAGEWLRARGLQREGQVGNAQAVLARAQDVIAAGRALLSEDRLVFLHGADEGCAECDMARRPIVSR